VTVTSNGRPYATVTMSCLPVTVTLFITLICCGETVGWIKDGVQVNPVPGNNVLGGDSPTQLPPREAVLHAVGEVSGVVTVSQLMQPCDSK